MITCSCKTVAYNIPSTKTPRATSLGYGRRFGDMIIKSEAPPPHKYNINSIDFNNKNKGYQFGMSRDKFTKVRIHS